MYEFLAVNIHLDQAMA